MRRDSHANALLQFVRGRGDLTDREVGFLALWTIQELVLKRRPAPSADALADRLCEIRGVARCSACGYEGGAEFDPVYDDWPRCPGCGVC